MVNASVLSLFRADNSALEHILLDIITPLPHDGSRTPP